MKLSFLNLFRIVFVVFSLFLLNDIFYRWDSLRYFASFFESISIVALLSVLWSLVALVATIAIWLPLKLYEWFSMCFEREKRRYLLLFEKIFILLVASTWAAKKLIWPDKAALEVKVIVFLCIVSVSTFLTWLLISKAGDWVDRVQEKIIPDIWRVIQERITLPVWLFGIFVVLSIPLVAYQTLFKYEDKAVPKEPARSFSQSDDRPNIILITFDALTARDMSVYGYHKETTPFITEWAKGASLFERTQAACNFTTPSVTSLMTGKRLWTHQIYQLRGIGHKRNRTENLPHTLKKNGYYNAAFIVNSYASVRTLEMAESFDAAPTAIEFMAPGNVLFGNTVNSPGFFDALLYRMFGEKIRYFEWITDDRLLLWGKFRKPLKRTAVPPEKAFNAFLDNYENIPKPFFAWIHLLPPHDPYLPPETYTGMFSEKGEIDKSDPDWAMVPARASYDEFIRYCDAQFEDFISKLQEKQPENTVIILSSDHGESFEHGVMGHTTPHLYEQLTHIPLIIKEPGQTDSKVVNSLVEQIDIPATILDLAKIPAPSWMEGRSLVPLIRGGELPQRPAFSMRFQENRSRGHQITKGTVAVWEGNYKLINYLGENRSLLFNILEDPGELDNLIDREPEIARRLDGLIQDNLEEANKRIAGEW